MRLRWKICLCCALSLLLLWLFCLPRDLFRDTPYSTVVTDRDGELLGARIADDGQWRFPPCDSVPEKFAVALTEFEDRWFRWHPGVNPASLLRAAVGNVKAGHVTSGGSTITMQVIRISRRKSRMLWQKLIEAFMATRLELSHSKDGILALYASHAPFGGNVVGLEAAAWRYCGCPASELSWAETAMMAVLPNSPSLMHPGKNRDALLAKRNRLLGRLQERGLLDSIGFRLACEEPLPEAPLPLPDCAPHLVEWYRSASLCQRVRSSVDIQLQMRTQNLVNYRSDALSASGASDMAAVVIDVHTGTILAYCGNSSPERDRPGKYVDIARSPRSTGSVLKPFLYCAMLQEGLMLPHSLQPDIPFNVNGFAPRNFDMSFRGAVPASDALAASLNVPAVMELRRYGVARFCSLLQDMGMSTLDKSPTHYGLSIVLGGAEATLFDVTSMYASMARACQEDLPSFPLCDKAALWYTLEALSAADRPDGLDADELPSVRKVAWKTGTSYGSRDAWAVGVTKDYAVGVWVGNAEGKEAPGATGAGTAAPVMMEIFDLLPREDDWFSLPSKEDCSLAEVCRETGFLKGTFCMECDSLMLPSRALSSATCPYHKMVDGESRFLLPTDMEWYYKGHHPEYRPLEKGRLSGSKSMDFIYPKDGCVMLIPSGPDGSSEGAVFALAHGDGNATVYWHLDNEYLGQTRFIHGMRVCPSSGNHLLAAVDNYGHSCESHFSVP